MAYGPAMLGVRKTSWIRVAVAIAYAAGMLLLPFSHRTVAAPSSPNDLVVYALPDGTVPVICRSGRTAGSSDTSTPATDKCPKVCDACRLTAAPGLGSVPAIPIALRSSVATTVRYWALARAPENSDFPYDGQSRGPPRT